jgi:hypothetical protein
MWFCSIKKFEKIMILACGQQPSADWTASTALGCNPGAFSGRENDRNHVQVFVNVNLIFDSK